MSVNIDDLLTEHNANKADIIDKVMQRKREEAEHSPDIDESAFDLVMQNLIKALVSPQIEEFKLQLSLLGTEAKQEVVYINKIISRLEGLYQPYLRFRDNSVKEEDKFTTAFPSNAVINNMALGAHFTTMADNGVITRKE